MPKYRVTGKVTGSVYLGEFEADSPEEAMEKAEAEACVSFCHQCADSCEDPEVEATDAEPVEGEPAKVEPEPPPSVGWGFPGASKKAHFFMGGGRSMCGKWWYSGSLENHSHESPDNCKECMRKRAAHYATKPKE